MAGLVSPRGSRLDWAIAFPLVVYAFYGMNMPLPGAKWEHTWLVLAVLTAVWMAAVFALRRD